jgi:dTDP-glucose 4,6-dehydratase
MIKRVLLTGHGGFVGHHCLEYFLEKTDWEIVCIDSFRHKGTCRRVVEVSSNNPRVKTYKHDLSVPIDAQLENLILERKAISYGVEHKPIHIIINMASESAVERSTQDPVACLKNNYDIAINMLEFARKCSHLEQFIHISTDEVYGEVAPNKSHKEWDPILPSNPYASSKAAQESLAIGYWRTYNLPIVITNIMNIIGERQDQEKFLPKIIRKILSQEEMPIYADSESDIGSRSYLYAKNVADALIFLSNKKPSTYQNLLTEKQSYDIRPDRYNICGDVEINNLDMAKLVAKIMKKELKYKLIKSESARPGYDRRYMLDGSKIKQLGWIAPFDFEESLEKIINWTLKNIHWGV